MQCLRRWWLLGLGIIFERTAVCLLCFFWAGEEGWGVVDMVEEARGIRARLLMGEGGVEVEGKVFD